MVQMYVGLRRYRYAEPASELSMQILRLVQSIDSARTRFRSQSLLLVCLSSACGSAVANVLCNMGLHMGLRQMSPLIAGGKHTAAAGADCAFRRASVASDGAGGGETQRCTVGAGLLGGRGLSCEART